MRKMISYALPALFALLATACESDVSSLLIAGRMNNVGATAVTARVEQPGATRIISDADFQAGDANKAVSMSVGVHGVMTITYTVTTTPDDTIAIAQVELGLHRNYEHSISVNRQTPNSSPICFGCTSIAKFPFRGSQKSTKDSLWVYIASRVPCKSCVY